MESFLVACSTIFFLKNSFAGLVFFSVTLLEPSVAVLGLCAYMVGEAVMDAFALPAGDPVRAIQRYNALLIGFAMGHLFSVSPLSILLVAGLSVLVYLLSFMLQRLLATYLALPVLNIPFTIAALIAYLATVRYSALNTALAPLSSKLDLAGLPFLLSGFFKATGQVFFMPYDLPGMVILAGVLIASPIMFFLATFSWFIGTGLQFLLKGSLYQAAMDPSSFNFIIVGVALGGVFLIPSRRSYLIAMTAVAVSVFVNDAVQVFCTQFQIPPFTIAFNISVLLFLYMLTLLRHPRLGSGLLATPEKALATFFGALRRFGKVLPEPHLPFHGEWTVYQGFDGPWTHVGQWRHAVDFVITDAEGRTHANQGRAVADYFCFGVPVIAPVSGYVVDAFDGFEDNIIGDIDRRNNWGNYCIIRSDFGYHVELSHLKKGSLACAVGSYIRVGMPVGLCGNSGNSPQPHLHMQIQMLPALGSPTVPFHWGNACASGLIVTDPAQIDSETRLSSLPTSKKRAHLLQFGLDDVFVYSVARNGVSTGLLELSVAIDPSGWYCLCDKAGKGKLFFGTRGNRFVFYSFSGSSSSPLRLLFLAAPAIPLFDEMEFAWEEPIPDELIRIADWRNIPLLRSLLGGGPGLIGRYALANPDIIRGELFYGKRQMGETTAILDSFRGFCQVTASIDGVRWELQYSGSNKK
jgi:urea transporter